MKRTPWFELPAWVPQDAWNEWLNMRAKKRAPNTPYAMNLAIGKLIALEKQGFTAKQVLDNCIMCGWVGIFPPRERVASQPNQVGPRGATAIEGLGVSEQDKLDFYRRTGVRLQ